MTKQYDFNSAQDWVPYFQRIFNIVEINSVLEFGLGLGTEFLCDNAKQVISVELSTGEFNREWTNKIKDKLKNYTNWTLKYIEIPDEIQQANLNAIENKYPLADTSYVPILQKMISTSLGRKKYDIIFIDPGIHNRGDIVNYCFNKAGIIAAHDTDRSGKVIPNIYGYNIVKVPENYEEIHFNDSYMGTTFWINEKYANAELVKSALKV